MTEWVTPQRLTSGVPVSPDLSPAEAATVARFDAAPDAEESLRRRLAIALWGVDTAEVTAGLTIDLGALWSGVVTHYPQDAAAYYRYADAAIAVMRGAS